MLVSVGPHTSVGFARGSSRTCAIETATDGACSRLRSSRSCCGSPTVSSIPPPTAVKAAWTWVERWQTPFPRTNEVGLWRWSGGAIPSRRCESDPFCIEPAFALPCIETICPAARTSFSRNIALRFLSTVASGTNTPHAHALAYPPHGRIGGARSSRATSSATAGFAASSDSWDGGWSRFGSAERVPPKGWNRSWTR
jgi:hypothetical protein